MKNNQQRFLDNISDKLAYLAQKVKQDNGANWTGTATISEGFYREFLNKLYDWDLSNLNIRQKNAEGIDLVSEDKKIIIQVSATKTHEKIQSSLNKIDIEKYKGYRFIFLIIGSKDKSSYRDFSVPSYITFNKEQDIWDHSYLQITAANTDIAM